MSEQAFTIRVDGKDVTCQPGETILNAAEGHDIRVPHICYHRNLGPIRTCDTCLVDVNGELRHSCATVAEPGMEVQTASKFARAAQQEAMQRILENHELYCTVCDNNNGNCRVHNTAELLQVDHNKYEFRPKPYPPDVSHPFYRYEPDQCILCGRCVEACQDLQVNETLSIDWSLERPRVLWDGGVPINESSCVSCGHCVTVCPCNALMEKDMLGEAGYLTGLPNQVMLPMIDLTKAVEPSYEGIFAISEVEAAMRGPRIKRTKTVCTYCGVGCSFEVWTKDRKVIRIEPQVEAPANGISTCVKGKWGWEFVNSDERLTAPLIRRGDTFVEATWDEAISLIVERLTEIKKKHGAGSIGVIASSKASNEDNFAAQKFARAVLGTNNVDNCSRYCQSPATAGLMRTVGLGGDAGSIYDIASADLVMIIGANPAESHPVLSTRVKRSHKLFGQKLIVADLRGHEMADRADLFVSPLPSTDLIWLNAVARYILDQGWEAKEFIAQRTNGMEEFVKSLDKYTIEYAEQMTGISREQLVKIATMIHEADNTCILWAMGVTQHTMGTDTSTAICNLLLLTGNFGRPGCGGYPLRGHNNVQGACDFGTMPAWFPGYEAVEDANVRAKYEKAWGVTLESKPGINNHQMVAAIHDGHMKAMYLFGEEMSLVDSNSNHVEDAFEKLDFFVVQDIFFSRTARFADVVLPAAPSLEKDGTFTNTERRIQRFYKALEPIGQAKPDWQIFQMIAKQMGHDWHYTHPSEIMAEAASLAPIFAGVTYERLKEWNSLQWPVAPDGTDTPVLYLKRFGFPDGKARFFPVEWTEPYNAGKEYDLHLNNGRILEHFHEGNMTYRNDGLTHKVPREWVEVSPDLAKERGIETGALVRLTSPYGEIETRVVVTERVHGNEVYMTMHTRDEERAVNRLTSSFHDRVTHTPNYKEMGVKMEVLEATGEDPIPSWNWRHAERVPQLGVLVEEKWKRPDYVPISQVLAKEGFADGQAAQQH
ncbi:MAG: oxidoreductase [Firmicutes bacterium]|nr:oxidoreductase [Bacillota bacterium]